MLKKQITPDQQAGTADRRHITCQLQITKVAGTCGMLSGKRQERKAVAADGKAGMPHRSSEPRSFAPTAPTSGRSAWDTISVAAGFACLQIGIQQQQQITTCLLSHPVTRHQIMPDEAHPGILGAPMWQRRGIGRDKDFQRRIIGPD